MNKTENNTKQYIVSERSNYMCPNMHFAIAFHVLADFDVAKVQQTLSMLQAAHPFLRSLIKQEEGTNQIYFQVESNLKIETRVQNAILADSEEEENRRFDEAFFKDYDELSARGWDTGREGLLKVLIYPKKQGFVCVLVAHHLLCDGRGLFQLSCEFADGYVKGVQPKIVNEQLVTELSQLPKGSDLPFISKQIVESANKNWRKENQRVSYEQYLQFEKEYIQNHPIHRNIQRMSTEQLQELVAQSKAAGVSVNDWMVAKMMVEDKVSKTVIAKDIRNELATYHPGAMGNYATAFSVVVKSKSSDIAVVAKKVSKQIKKSIANPQKEMLILACFLRMEPTLLDAVVISTLGDFNSKAGFFVGAKMFGYQEQNGHSISNLGKFESETMREAIFIPPFSPANEKLVGILTVNGRMNLCTFTSK